MKVITLGEIMLRLSPDGNKRLVQSESLNVTFGGAEANVAVALANWGVYSAFLTKLPLHEIGQAAVNSLRRYGVDTSYILRGGNRVGAYYCESGASQRPSKVIYDRAGSAIALAKAEEFDFKNVFADKPWFHVTGITPALGADALDLTLKAIFEAREAGCIVSFDVNYRSKLWDKAQACEAIKKILPCVNVFIANENQVTEILGIKSPYAPPKNDEYQPEVNAFFAEKLINEYKFDAVALTARRTVSSEVNTFRAMLAVAEKTVFSREYTINIVDRVGSGDAFAAGIIYSLLNDKNPDEAVEFSTAAAVLAHSVEGDYTLVSVDEVDSLVNFGSAKVQR